MKPLHIVATLVCGIPVLLLLVMWSLSLREIAVQRLIDARKQGVA